MRNLSDYEIVAAFAFFDLLAAIVSQFQSKENHKPNDKGGNDEYPNKALETIHVRSVRFYQDGSELVCVWHASWGIVHAEDNVGLRKAKKESERKGR